MRARRSRRTSSSSRPRRSSPRSAGARCSSTRAMLGLDEALSRLPARRHRLRARDRLPRGLVERYCRIVPKRGGRLHAGDDRAPLHPELGPRASRRRCCARSASSASTTSTPRSRSACASGACSTSQPALASEVELRRDLEATARRATRAAREPLSFLGRRLLAALRAGGRATRSSNRGEFLTAYYGETYTDHGKLQAFFEYASMVGELVELDAVSQPTYDWAYGGGDARSAWRRGITGRAAALVPASISPERLAVIDGVLRAAGRRSRRCRSTPTTGLARPRRLCDARCSATTSPASTSRTRATSARSRPESRRSPSSRTRRARSPSSASTRSRSACSRRRRATAPTSSAATCSRSASTCTSAAASPGFIATPDDGALRRRVPDLPGRARAAPTRGRVRLRRGRLGAHVLRPARRGARVRGHDAVPLGDRRRPSTSSLMGPHGMRGARAGHHAALAVRGAARSASSRACARRALDARRSSRSSSSI